MGKKILVVEDDSVLQMTLKDFLSSKGLEVVSAINGEEGIRFAKVSNPDIILLDLILPKKDGFEVLKEIKSDPTTKETPVILLTNLEGLNNIQRAIEMGASTYLVKSDYKLEEIYEKIKETLEK